MLILIYIIENLNIFNW